MRGGEGCPGTDQIRVMCARQCEISKKGKKGESRNRPEFQRMEILDAMNWTRRRVRPGASFRARGKGGGVQGRPISRSSARQRFARSSIVANSTFAHLLFLHCSSHLSLLLQVLLLFVCRSPYIVQELSSPLAD